MRLGLHPALPLPLEAVVLRREFVGGDDLTEGERAVARLDHLEVVDDPAALHLLVGALDEPVLVDVGVGRQRGDEADVRPLGSLDGTDAAVVRSMHVPDLEARALARQPPGPQGGQPPLVGDLGQRIRLVHELRELGRTEELLDRRDDRLGVDQVVRHRRVDVLVHGHLLLDRPLHPHQADPELVLEQLADRAHPAIAQVVDVVDLPHVLLQLQQVLDHPVEVLRFEDPLVLRLLRVRRVAVVRHVELDVELEPAHPREVVPLGVEEHAVEERTGALVGRRVAGTHPPVDLDLRFLGVPGRVLRQGVRNRGAAQLPVGEEHLELAVVAAVEPLVEILGNRLVRLEQHLAGVLVDHVGDQEGRLQLLRPDLGLDVVAGVKPLDRRLVQRQAGEDAVAMTDAPARAFAQTLALQHFGTDAEAVHAAALDGQRQRGVELAEDPLVRLQAQGAQEDGAVELALAVDPDREDVLLVVLELDPGAAVGDDLRQVDALVAGEEDAGAAVQLAHDHPLGAVDDERAGVGHQRDLAEVDLFLLGVPHHPLAGLRVLVVDEEPERDLERHGVGHPPRAALVLRVLVLEVDGLAAGLALRDAIHVHGAALSAGHGVLVGVPGLDLRAAVRARHPHVLEPLQPLEGLATLFDAATLPVADRVADEVERTGLPEVPEREDPGEHRLQAVVRPLLREQVLLQEPVVRAALHPDQVGDGQRRLDGREVDPPVAGAVAVAVAVTVLRN